MKAPHKSPSSPTPTATSTEGKPFGFSYDKQLFENLEDLECEETERTELNKVHQQLIETQKYFDGEAEKCTAFIEEATEMRECKEQREQRIAAEAKRLSDAKFAAQAHAVQVPCDGGNAGAVGGDQEL
ncbi:unnamed protein product [Prorocentrum cordatum]|uniref:Uncharacterized protein n=1 Tax=Prorocentrum cordatum TaxID=2364126 RepID=A0ABN9YCF0_9DINO|nr:unnamed protein product [Polarella glacialis]